jgi:hypothetical protein
MALTRNRQGLLVVDLLVELDTSWPETTEVFCKEDDTKYIKRASGFISTSGGGGGGGGVSDGDKGDITVSGGGTVWTVDREILNSSYAAGSFTVATGTYKLLGKRLELTTTQQAQVIGTGRLAIRN